MEFIYTRYNQNEIIFFCILKRLDKWIKKNVNGINKKKKKCLLVYLNDIEAWNDSKYTGEYCVLHSSVIYRAMTIQL